jgi:2-polyprenyl-6-methoxyphenol hydroxylase-like FAD-dependent oxidoreductase
MPSVRDVDIVIVGGGMAGSSLAASLARAGLGVAVVERERRFHDRVRGESIHPWGVGVAQELGLLEVLAASGGRALPSWRQYEGRELRTSFDWREAAPEGLSEWAIYHPGMQEGLLVHAASTGAAVMRPARAEVVSGGARPEVDVIADDGRTTRLRARLLVGADGRQSAVRRRLGSRSERDPVHHAIGGGLLDGVALDADATHVAARPGRMILVFPQGGGRARAYVACSTEESAGFRGAAGSSAFVNAVREAFPEEAFGDAAPAGPTAFFPNADQWSSRLAGESIVLIGDAAGANDPSIGHGLSISFRDARELRNLLTDGTPWDRALREYEVRRRRYFEVFRTYARWLTMLVIDQGPEADRRRERTARAWELDPTRGGFSRLRAYGADGVVANEAARRHFFGEDLTG